MASKIVYPVVEVREIDSLSESAMNVPTTYRARQIYRAEGILSGDEHRREARVPEGLENLHYIFMPDGKPTYLNLHWASALTA